MVHATDAKKIIRIVLAIEEKNEIRPPTDQFLSWYVVMLDQVVFTFFRHFSCFTEALLQKRSHTRYLRWQQTLHNSTTRQNLPISNSPLCIAGTCDLIMQIKNPAHGRHQLSPPMRIVGPIQI